MSINKIHSNNLRNDEHFQFTSDNIDLLREYGPNTLGVNTLFDEYVLRFADEDEALKKILKSDYTRQLNLLDTARDNDFYVILTVVTAYLRHFMQEIREAATRLKIALDTFGNIARKGLNEQTSATTNLLQELKGKYKNEVALCRVKDVTDNMEMNNLEFIRVMKLRDDEITGRTEVVLREARAKVDETFSEICKRIDALVIVEGSAKYAEYIKKLNNLIDRHTKALKMRRGAAKAAKE